MAWVNLYPGFVRIFSSYLKKNRGKGTNVRVKNPERLVPRPEPIVSYIDRLQSSKGASMSERTTVAAVAAVVGGASYRRFVSMR
jgi:hypothetical protein